MAQRKKTVKKISPKKPHAVKPSLKKTVTRVSRPIQKPMKSAAKPVRALAKKSARPARKQAVKSVQKKKIAVTRNSQLPVVVPQNTVAVAKMAEKTDWTVPPEKNTSALIQITPSSESAPILGSNTPAEPVAPPAPSKNQEASVSPTTVPVVLAEPVKAAEPLKVEPVALPPRGDFTLVVKIHKGLFGRLKNTEILLLSQGRCMATAQTDDAGLATFRDLSAGAYALSMNYKNNSINKEIVLKDGCMVTWHVW